MLFECAARRGSIATAVLMAMLARVPVASAASAENRAAARQHLKRAQDLKKQGQLAESCHHLEEVERLDPKLPTLIELAECTERQGKLVEAQALWSLARDRAKHDEKPQSRARAESRLAAVQKRVAHLTLQLTSVPAGAQVVCDDVVLEPASLTGALPLNPGAHVVVVKLAGHDDAKYSVTLAAGDKQTLPIAAGPVTATRTSLPPASPSAPALPPSPAAPPPPTKEISPPSEPPAQAATSWWSGERKAGVVFGVAGIAALGAGSALYFVANRAAEKEGSLVDTRRSLGAISIVSGGVLLLSGVVVLAGASSEQAPQHARLMLTPTLLVGRSGTVLGAAGMF